MVRGRVAIAAMWKSIAGHVGAPKLTTIDVKRLGSSAAREMGTFSLKIKCPIQDEITGKYVVVWEKSGRDWMLATDIWNDDSGNDISNRESNERSGGNLFDSLRRHKPR